MVKLLAVLVCVAPSLVLGADYLWPATYNWPQAQYAPVKHLLFFTQKSCPPCRQEEAEFAKLKQKGWLVEKLGTTSNISIVDINEFQEIADKYSITQTPTFILIEGDKRLSQRVGFQTSDQISRWYKAEKETTRKVYPQRSSNWTGPDGRHQLYSREQAIQHLLEDGTHRGKFTRLQLQQMTLSELRALHSDDHEGRVQTQYIPSTP